MEARNDGRQQHDNELEHDPHFVHDYAVHPIRCKRCQWEDQRVQQRLRNAELRGRDSGHLDQ